MKSKMTWFYSKRNESKVKYWFIFSIIALLFFHTTSVGARDEQTNLSKPNAPFAVAATQCIDFNQIPVNTSVEGLGAVNKYLNISTSSGGAITLQEDQDPFA